MGKYIKYFTLGKLNKNLKYIFLFILFKLVCDIVKGVNYEEIFKTMRLFGESKVGFPLHNFIHQIFSYFGIFSLSLILIKVEKKLSETNIDKPTIVTESDDKGSDKSKYSIKGTKSNKSNLSIQLIHNSDLTGFDYMHIFYSIVLTIFILVIAEQFLALYGITLKDLDCWMFEIVILSQINAKMFNIKIYKHQKIGLILNIFSFAFKICTIIISFLDDKKEIKPIYVKYNIFLLGIIGFIIYLFSITLRSYSYVKLKWFMDKRYILISKILVIYGFMGTITSIIISLVSTYIKCKNYNNKIEFNDYICNIKNNIFSYDNYTEIYFESFKIYFKKFSCKDSTEIEHEILSIFLLMIFYFFNSYFSMLVIKFLSPVYAIFGLPSYFLIQKIILGIYTLIRKHSFFVNDNNKNEYSIYKFYCDISGDLLSISGFLIYLEIIELNFCDINYNVKRNIEKRSEKDLKEMKQLLANSSISSEDLDVSNIFSQSYDN